MKVGDIIVIKNLPGWGECIIKELYGNSDKIYYEVSPLNKTEGITFLMGLTTEDVKLVREAEKKEEI